MTARASAAEAGPTDPEMSTAAATRRSARSRRRAPRGWCRPGTDRGRSRAGSASPASACASSQRLSWGPSTSGWNWTARCRPMLNACTADLVARQDGGRGEGRQRSSWNSSQGPAGTTSVIERFDHASSRSPGAVMASTRPPNAAHSAWAPKQMPSTGTPAWSAARSQASSAVIQGSGSLTELTAPSTTTWSTPSSAGSGPSSGNRWTEGSAPRASNASAMKPAESMSWCLMTRTRIPPSLL